MSKNILINGPVNSIRLEGSIGKEKKTIYIFGDYHLQCESQTTCNNDEAKNIDQFLIEEFKKLDHLVDFFLEISPYNIYSYKLFGDRIKYILELRNFFARNFDIGKDNQVKQSDKYPNVRFHYGDIRADNNLLENYMISIFDLEDNFGELSLNFFISNKSYFNVAYEKISKIINSSLQLDKITDDILKNFNNIYYFKKFKKIKNAQVKKILTSYLNKIKDNMKNTKKNLKKYIDTFINCLTLYNKNDKLDNEYIIKNIITPIMDCVNEFGTMAGFQICTMMDIYILRRLLDKNYISTGILYCGMAHSANMINILVKDFNFKITHSSKNIDIDKINKDIKTKNYKFEKELIGLLIDFDMSKKDIQCSDLSKFPKNFQ